MVATLFVCVSILYSSSKGLPKVPYGKINEPDEADRQAAAGHRRAA